MEVTEHTEQIDDIQYQLTVRDEEGGFAASWFCCKCRIGGVNPELVSSLDSAMAQAGRLSLVHHRCEHQALPESLVISLDKKHNEAVVKWWELLTEDEQGQFLDVATLTPAKIAEPVSLECTEEDETANQWYEYVINQDVRFYFDRSATNGHYNLAAPSVNASCSSADIKVVNYLLKNPREKDD